MAKVNGKFRSPGPKPSLIHCPRNILNWAAAYSLNSCSKCCRLSTRSHGVKNSRKVVTTHFPYYMFPKATILTYTKSVRDLPHTATLTETERFVKIYTGVTNNFLPRES